MKSNNKKQQNIDKIIKQSFTESRQELYLYDKANDWQNVITHREWTQLKILYLHKCQINEINLIVITKLAWPNLKQLKLDKNNIGLNGAKMLSKINAKSLQNIWLSWCSIGQEGVKHIIKGSWPKLTILRLEQFGLSMNSYEIIYQIGWKQMELIGLTEGSAIAMLGYLATTNCSNTHIYQFSNFFQNAILTRNQKFILILGPIFNSKNNQ